MSQSVTVLDYGIGNLLNVVRALGHEGAQVTVVERASQAPLSIDRMVLPGVGAFANGMREMHERGLTDLVLQHAGSGRPFLGICVGMQMLFDGSDEFGDTAGLGIIRGRVRAIEPAGLNGVKHRIPHIGWTPLHSVVGGGNWAQGILKGTPEREHVYCVHSFHGIPMDGSQSLATVDYNGLAIGAAVQTSNVYGLQFHPERSGPAGLAILRNFLAL